ncbi:MAG: hypothetical protein JOZ33_07710 [Acidobacteriaceae bacterium]|nr:hypothetical protein [Acidobacteriaceae bacterium]
MGKFSEQLQAGYQLHSLIEFMLGDGTQPGWLDKEISNLLLSRTAGAGEKSGPV